MARIIPLQYLDEFANDELADLIEEAMRPTSLREAVETVIRAIHGLPDALGAELQKIEIYVGRAGASAMHVRNRWWARLDYFDYAPSTHALVVARTSTEILRGERWERAAQLIVNRLEEKRALCCANALYGESGKWPGTTDSVIYLVAKVRRGPPKAPATTNQVNAAVAQLVMDAGSEAFPAEVFVAAGQRIQLRDDATDHEVTDPRHWYDDDDDDDEWEMPSCRRDDCETPAKPGNYGFCGRHRPYLGAGQKPCRECGRPALEGNYGFCGLHRR